MRNPDRIRHMLFYINLIWNKCPDIRFNQLIHNLQFKYGEEKGCTRELWTRNDDCSYITSYIQYTVPDLFNVEDEEFIEFLKKKLDEYSK